MRLNTKLSVGRSSKKGRNRGFTCERQRRSESKLLDRITAHLLSVAAGIGAAFAMRLP
jgi:hypothetical protein